jgi:hypothetical protein
MGEAEAEEERVVNSHHEFAMQPVTGRCWT